MLAAADVLVTSMLLTRATQNLIGYRELARMKSTAILVNAARPGIIVEGALYEHLRANPDCSAVAGSHAVAAKHAAENVRRLQDGSLAGTVRRGDYLPT